MMPMSAQSSLSHCTTTRPGMEAGSSGTTESRRPSQITMPPECCPKCRGRSCTARHNSKYFRIRGCARSRPASRRRRSSASFSSLNSQVATAAEIRFSVSSSNPITLPISRAAMRFRYVITLAVMAAPRCP